MSSYMVDDLTINKVVACLSRHVMRNTSLAWFIVEAGYNLREFPARKKLADDMFQLNIDGVNAKYGDGEAEKFRPLDFRYQHIAVVKDIDAYKALGSWRYQCSEGNVPDTEFYQFMTRVYHGLAHRIVQRSPEYEKAERR